nr:phage integrase [uncultured Mediterranean phage uvMED]
MELNINKVPIKDKKGNVKMYWRWNYISAKNTPKAITKIKKVDVIKKAQLKIKEIGFIKTSTQEVLLNEANISFQKWLKYKMREGKVNLHHTQNYASFFKNHILPFFNNIDIRNIGENEVNNFVQHLSNKLFQECPSCDEQNSSKAKLCEKCGYKLTPKKDALEPKTVRKIFNTLSLIIQNQVDPPNRKLPRNICKDINWMAKVVTKRAKPKVIDFEIWTPKYVAKLIDHIQRYLVKLVCKILLQTACRPSEVRVLTRKDLINFDPKSNLPPMINIDKAMKCGTKKIGDTKTINGHRQLVITSQLRDEINNYVKTLPMDQEHLFLDNVGSPLRLEAISRGIDKALKINGARLPIDRKGYFFRHYTASFWAYTSKYTNAIDLAKALGDKSIDFVSETYIKPYKNNNQEIVHTDYQEKHFTN